MSKAATSTQTSLTKEQKQAVGLLSIGTFLEYFDLMRYVHMAVFLNELFFPKSDPHMESLLAAFAFCSTYLFRPFGALIFGYIGDNYGRKPTVIITTAMMAISCFVIAILPAYAEIGITASIIITLLRVMQGLSSLAEVMGAQIYISEITKPPLQYSAVSIISISAGLGAMMSLAIATPIVQGFGSWRYAFAFGILIALVGTKARTKLRESIDFVDAKRRFKSKLNAAKKCGYDGDIKKVMSASVVCNRVNIKNFLNFLGIYCGWPFSFYLIYIYFSSLLRSTCGYSPNDVIFHNLFISILQLLTSIVLTWLSRKIYPLIILKVTTIFAFMVLLITPIILNMEINNYIIFVIQALLIMFSLSVCPAAAVFIKHFPIFKRFTAVTLGYALSRAVMYIVVSFGLIYLVELFGFYGIWVLAFPMVILRINAIYHYSALEKSQGSYPVGGKLQNLH
ncbi:MAG: MFS transporter [Rickettsiaceae bacterium]